tara:strand:+ start:224 stop:826 length:603 start_codon:yes stop_codon:yes gene_type:complete
MNPLIRLQIFLFLPFCLLCTSGLLIAQSARWEIDPEHFSIVFEVEHIGYQSQLGLFLEGSGEFDFDPETFEFFSGRVEIQAESIFSNNDDRDDHLRGRDFLNSRRHPTILFEASEFLLNQQRSGGELRGNLTLLGKTNPITLNVKLNKFARYPFGHRKETIGISASTVIERSKWGMDYGVSNYMVGDKVILRFEFEAVQE